MKYCLTKIKDRNMMDIGDAPTMKISIMRLILLIMVNKVTETKIKSQKEINIELNSQGMNGTFLHPAS